MNVNVIKVEFIYKLLCMYMYLLNNNVIIDVNNLI